MTSPLPIPEEKDRVRLNAVKHGSFSQSIVLPDEDQSNFEQYGKMLEARYRPQTLEERELVQVLQATQWRLERAMITERNLYVLTEQQQLASIDELFGELDPDSRRALAQVAGVQANSRLFDQLSRDEGRLQRILDRTRCDLDRMIAERRQAIAVASQQLPEQSQPAPFVPNQAAPQMPQFTGSLAEFKRKQWLKQQAKLNLPSISA